MEETLNAYKVAADYGVADVTTAATYRIAGSTAIRQGADGVGAAEEALQGRARPVQRAARGAGVPVRGEGDRAARDQRSPRRAGVYDKWVKSSFDALRELRPVRYGKTEVSEGVVDAIR